MNQDERRRWCDRIFNSYEVKCDRVAPYRNDSDASLIEKCRERQGLSEDMWQCADARNAYDVHPIRDGSAMGTKRTCADILRKPYRDSHLFEAGEMSRRAGLCAEAFRTRERAPPRAPGAPKVIESALPAHHESSSESDDIPEEPQSSMPSAPEASSASAAKAARHKRRKKRLREEKDIEAFLAQAAREAQSELDLLPLPVIREG